MLQRRMPRGLVSLYFDTARCDSWMHLARESARQSRIALAEADKRLENPFSSAADPSPSGNCLC